MLKLHLYFLMGPKKTPKIFVVNIYVNIYVVHYWVFIAYCKNHIIKLNKGLAFTCFQHIFSFVLNQAYVDSAPKRSDRLNRIWGQYEWWPCIWMCLRACLKGTWELWAFLFSFSLINCAFRLENDLGTMCDQTPGEFSTV